MTTGVAWQRPHVALQLALHSTQCYSILLEGQQQARLPVMESGKQFRHVSPEIVSNTPRGGTVMVYSLADFGTVCILVYALDGSSICRP